MNFAVPCLLGVESFIADELRNLDAQDVRAENGRVLFCGGEELIARVNIASRFAERVQILIGEFEAHSFEDLFQGAKALPWEEWIGAQDAFPVKGYSLKSDLFSVRDCQAIIKKAVVERLKSKYALEWFEETGAVRQIQFAILQNRVSMLIDTTGVALHKRGYRPEAKEAPIKETLAAALCAASKLRPYHTLYDPMCGSGTIAIEGALIARNIAPGLRRAFSAERWEQIPRAVWDLERERAKDLERPAPEFAAYGFDVDPEAVTLAKETAARAGVSDCVSFAVRDLAAFAPQTERGTVICNPPYGERLLDVEQARALVRVMGKVFPQKRGWSYSIITPDVGFEGDFGRSADKRRKLYNGMIACTLYMYYKA
ncbi:MAG: class I SAM-dependent RNA methyltransferase [Oscillospiraceae bacterium]|jgi:putative N6-adenine-specific DNA methylase|nr:class I SAM-dependent RNA methyltransferase [Oscillospiraceae bacterium]